MTTYQYLNQIYRLYRKIRALELYEERLRDEAEGISAQPLDKPNVKGGTRDNLAIMARLIDCGNNARDAKLEMIEVRDRIAGEIQALDNGVYVELLTRRYIMFEKYSEIARSMAYSEMQIYRLRKRALIAFEKKYGGTYVDA